MNEQRQIYYRELSKVQNMLKIPVDIVTFTGFMDWNEKMQHLKRYAEQVNYTIQGL